MKWLVAVSFNLMKIKQCVSKTLTKTYWENGEIKTKNLVIQLADDMYFEERKGYFLGNGKLCYFSQRIKSGNMICVRYKEWCYKGRKRLEFVKKDSNRWIKYYQSYYKCSYAMDWKPVRKK